MKKYGINQYIQLLTLVPIIVITVGMTLFFLRDYFSEIDHNNFERGKLIASQLESSSEYGVALDNLPLLQQIAHDVLQQQDVRGVIIMDQDTKFLAEAGHFSELLKNSLTDIQKSFTSDSNPGIRSSDEYLLVFQPIFTEPVAISEFERAPAARAIGAVAIEISLERIKGLKRTVLMQVVAGAAAFLFVVGAIVSIASRRIIKPISMMSESIRAIAEGKLDVRTNQQTHIHELGNLSENINKMAQQLLENQSVLERKINTATHELRRRVIEAEQARLELMESEERYRHLYTNTPVMLHSIDHNGVIVSVSDYWLSHMGYERGEVIGKKSTDFLTEASRRYAAEEVLPAFMKAGSCSDIYYQFVKKDGTVIDTLLSAIVEKDNEGRYIRSLAVIVDITERRKAQEALVAAKHQAESANQAKSRFLAAASHDLRQPVHALGLFLSVLSRTELTAQQRELLASSTSALDASRKMLDTLLDLSRIEAGVIRPQISPFYLQPMFNKIECELALQADEKGIIYRTRETHVAVQSDPALVEMILRNLVSNAIRYTKQGGLLVACRRRSGHAVIEVWDTGIGIPYEQQGEVFREFYQVNPEGVAQKGLGLGLAIAMGLAKALGHELSLISVPQRGSVFRLALPVAQSPVPSEAGSPDQHKVKLLGANILIIDDDETVLAGMCRQITDWGCRCDVADSIEEAVNLAKARSPDAIVSDYRLGKSHTGVDAIKTIRAILGKDLPALLITGDTAPERLREAEASAIPLLHKPVAPSQLYLSLIQILGDASDE